MSLLAYVANSLAVLLGVTLVLITLALAYSSEDDHEQ